MLFLELIKVALSSLWGQKLRSFLATLGIVIGVAALLTMFSIGYGARAKVTESVRRLGTELIYIRPELPRRGLVRHLAVETLTMGDAEVIRSEIPDIQGVTADAYGSVQARYFSQNRSTSLLGTSAEFPQVRDWNVVEGRFFNDVDVRLARKVVVLVMELRPDETIWPTSTYFLSTVPLMGASILVSPRVSFA